MNAMTADIMKAIGGKPTQVWIVTATDGTHTRRDEYATEWIAREVAAEYNAMQDLTATVTKA